MDFTKPEAIGTWVRFASPLPEGVTHPETATRNFSNIGIVAHLITYEGHTPIVLSVRETLETGVCEWEVVPPYDMWQIPVPEEYTPEDVVMLETAARERWPSTKDLGVG